MKTRAQRISTWIILAIIFTVLQVNQSLRQGQLALPITYDDNGYFADALTRLKTLYDQGIWSLLLHFISSPPHSPLSSIVPLMGFALFGITDYAPALTNGFLVFGLLLFVGYLTRDLSYSIAVLISLSVLTWPIVGHLVIESRPDLTAGLTLSVSIIAICSEKFKRSPMFQYATGLIIGLALLMKPIVFFVVSITAISALTFSYLFGSASYNNSTVSRAFYQYLIRVLLAACFIALPYYLLNINHIILYIYTNIFGSDKNIWRLHLSLTEQLAYHLTGPGGKMMLGQWFYGWLLTVVLTSLIAIKRRDQSYKYFAFPFIGTFLIAFFLVSLPAHNTPYQGAIISWSILISWVIAVLYLVRLLLNTSVGNIAATLVAILFLFFGMLSFTWPWSSKTGNFNGVPTEEARYSHKLLEDVLASLTKPRTYDSSVFVLGSSWYLNATTLAYYAEKNGNYDIKFDDLHRSNNFNLYVETINRSDSLIAFSEDNPDLIGILPSSETNFQKSLLEFISKQKDFCLVATFEEPDGYGKIYVYRKPSPFAGFKALDGLGISEGPYPQWNLPKVRWGLGPATKLNIDLGESGTSILNLEAKPVSADQDIEVILNGASIFTHRFLQKTSFENIDIPLKGHPGQNLVELRYKIWHTPSDKEPDLRQMAVLYKKISLNVDCHVSTR